MKQNEQEAAKKKVYNLPPFEEALYRNRRVVCGKVRVPTCVPPVRASMKKPVTAQPTIDLKEVALRQHRRESIRQAIRRRVSIAQLHANKTKLAIQSLLSLNDNIQAV